MSISSVWRIFQFQYTPTFLLNVKDSDLIMILFAVISTKHIQIVLIKGRWMVLFRRSLNIAFLLKLNHFPLFRSFNKRIKWFRRTFHFWRIRLETGVNFTIIIRSVWRFEILNQVIPLVIALRLTTNKFVLLFFLVVST